MAEALVSFVSFSFSSVCVSLSIRSHRASARLIWPPPVFEVRIRIFFWLSIKTPIFIADTKPRHGWWPLATFDDTAGNHLEVERVVEHLGIVLPCKGWRTNSCTRTRCDCHPSHTLGKESCAYTHTRIIIHAGEEIPLRCKIVNPPDPFLLLYHPPPPPLNRYTLSPSTHATHT